MLLYHVTTAQAAKSIRSIGVSPVFSQGKQKRSWYVNEKRLMWAIAHTSARHGVPTCGLVVITVDVCARNVRRWSLDGVFYSKEIETITLRMERVGETYLNNLIDLSEPKGDEDDRE